MERSRTSSPPHHQLQILRGQSWKDRKRPPCGMGVAEHGGLGKARAGLSSAPWDRCSAALWREG